MQDSETPAASLTIEIMSSVDSGTGGVIGKRLWRAEIIHSQQRMQFLHSELSSMGEDLWACCRSLTMGD